MNIPESHPRYKSLKTREKIVNSYKDGYVAAEGLIAHGRGEAFDYLLGETMDIYSADAIRAAACLLLNAKYPVISVNGNAASLVPDEIIELSKIVNAKIEINLFYRTEQRELSIYNTMIEHGANEILGIDKRNSTKLPEPDSARRVVDKNGIFISDVVLIPLEDGDRTESLIKMGKKVIAIDLNPLSRTSMMADIAIVNNIIRVMPELIKESKYFRNNNKKCNSILNDFDNKKNVAGSIEIIKDNLLKKYNELYR